MAASSASVCRAVGGVGRGGEPYPSSTRPPPKPPAPWLSFCWLGQPPGPVPARRADSAGWLAQARGSEANCPAEMGIRRGAGPTSSPLLPSLGYLFQPSEDRCAGPYWQRWEILQRDLCPGPKATMIAFHSCLQSYQATRRSDLRGLKVLSLASYTLAPASIARFASRSLTHSVTFFYLLLWTQAKRCCLSATDTLV